MPLTAYTANLIATAHANGTSYQGPATVHLALVTTTPTKTVAGTEQTLGVGNYARKSFATSGWTNDGAGGLVNTAELAYPTTDEDYDDAIVAVEAYSASTAGTRLWFIVLANARLVTSGTIPRFPAGDLELTFV